MSSLWEVMKVFGLDIPNHRGLTNLDLSEYAKKLGIEHFRGGGGVLRLWCNGTLYLIIT